MTTPADQPDALTAFIVARLDDEHALAGRLAERYVVRNPDHSRHGQPFWPLPSVEASFRNVGDLDIAAGLDLIKMYDPARVLRQVERDRRILADHARGQAGFIWVKSAEVTDRSEVMEEWTNAEGARLARVPYWICTRCTDWYPDAEIDDDPHASHEWPCLTVRLLALSYAEHPDYRSEWMPQP